MKRTEISTLDYNPYYQNYIDLVADVPLLEALESGFPETETFFNNLPSLKWTYRYQENKWTPKDILQHIIDTERVFCYRALYFARTENATLAGFDENIFAANAKANNKTHLSLIHEYKTVRAATISLFKGIEDAQLKNRGVANNNSMSVAAAGFIICGHEIHHRNIINERYF